MEGQHRSCRWRTPRKGSVASPAPGVHAGGLHGHSGSEPMTSTPPGLTKWGTRDKKGGGGTELSGSASGPHVADHGPLAAGAPLLHYSQGSPPSIAPAAQDLPLPEGARPFCFGLRPPTQEGWPAPYCSHHPASAFLVSSGGEPVMRSLCLQRAGGQTGCPFSGPPQLPAPCRAVLIFSGQTL